MNYQRGSLLMEVVVATAVFVACVVAIYSAARVSLIGVTGATKKIQAAFLLDGMIDELKFIRDKNWNTIKDANVGEKYCLTQDTSEELKLSKSPCPTPSDGFTRTVIFSAYGSGSTIDYNLKNAAMKVSWQSSGGIERSVSADMVIGNIFRCDQ